MDRPAATLALHDTRAESLADAYELHKLVDRDHPELSVGHQSTTGFFFTHLVLPDFSWAALRAKG